jgi:hypothetical protein
MSQSELLIYLAQRLDAAGVRYMVTGSIASSYYGQPRSTHDIDLVVELDPASIPALRTAFPASDFYFNEISAEEAILRADMFNIIELKSMDKIDFWVLDRKPWNRSRFSRRTLEQVGEVRVWMARPDDLILSKLQWAQMSGGSEKQMGDAVSVYEVQFPGLDQPYLDRWARDLGVEAELAEVRRRAQLP